MVQKIDLKPNVFACFLSLLSLFREIPNRLFYSADILFLSWQHSSALYDKCAPLTCTITFVFQCRKAVPISWVLLAVSLFLPFLFLFVGYGSTCSCMLYLRFNFQSKIKGAKRHLLQVSNYFWLTWSILHQNASLLTTQNVFSLNKISRS